MIRVNRFGPLLVAAVVLAGCPVNELGNIPCQDNANCPADYPTCSAKGFCVNPAAPASLEISSGTPQVAVAGAAPAQPLVVKVTDTNGNAVQGFTVTWAVQSGGGSLSATTTTTGPDGKASTTATLGKTAGANVFTATAAGLANSPVSFSLQGTAGSAAKFLRVSGDNQYGASSSPLPTPLAVKVTDVNDNAVAGAAVAWSAVAGGGSVESANTITDASGVAQTVAVLGAAGGSNSFRAAVPAEAALAPLQFSAVGANNVVRTSPGLQTGVPGAALLSQLVVEVTDASNNPIAGFPVSWAAVSGGGSVSSGATTTDATGLAFVTATLGPSPATTNTFTATATGLTGSPVTFTGNSAAKVVLVSGDLQSALPGTVLSSPLVVRVTDAVDNAVKGFPVAFAAAVGGGSVTSATVNTDLNGMAQTTATLGAVAGTNTFTATATGLANSPITFTAFSGSSLSKSAGDNQVGIAGQPLAQPLVVLVKDAANNPIPSFTVTWSVGSGGGLVSAGTSITNASGLASVNATLGSGGGINTYVASATGVSPVTFTAIAAKSISVSAGDNQTGVAGTALGSPLVVLVTDGQGSPSPVAGITVHWAAATGGGSVSATTSVTDASGLASINATLGATGGANTYTATVAGLTGSPVTFTARAAKTIARNAGNTQTGVAGAALTNPLVVKVTDNGGVAVGGITVNWAAATGGGSVSAATSVTDASGLASITATLGATGGTNTFTATVVGLTGSPITFTATAAKNLALLSGDGQTGVAGAVLASPLSVKVTDNLGIAVAGITVNWAAATGGGSVSAGSSVTNGSGVASITATLGTAGGTNTFTAAVLGLTGSPVTFTAVGAKIIAVNSGNNQTGVAGAALGSALQVKVTDNANNPVAGITVNWAASTGGGSVSAATSVTDAAGLASTNATLGTAGGTNTYTATVAGLTGSPVTFTAIAAKAIAIGSGDGQTGVAGAVLSSPLVVLVTDGSAVPVSGITVHWAVSSGGGSVSAATSISDSSGLASINATLGTVGGTNTYTATVAGLTGSPVSFTATAAKNVAANAGNNQTGVVGTALANPLVVKVTDNGGVAVAGITVGWSVVAGGGSVSASSSVTNASGLASINATLGATGGTNTYRATVAGLTGSPVSFSARAASNISVSAGNNQFGKSGQPLANQLAVLVTDGTNPVAGITVNWAAGAGGGSVGAATSVTDVTGVAAITATLGAAGGGNTFTASVAGLTGSPISFSAVGANNVVGDATTDNQSGVKGQVLNPLVVTVTDQAGNPVPNFPVAWAAIQGGGSITPASTVTDATGKASSTPTLGTKITNLYTATATGFTAITFTATATNGSPPIAPGGFGSTATVVSGGSMDGLVFIAGGSTTADASGALAQSTSIYDPATGKTTAGPSLQFARAFHAAIAVGNGQVVLAGGTSTSSGATLFELCTLGASSSCVSAGAAMTEPRCNAAAALVTADPARVLVAGGGACDGSAAQSSWALWDASAPDVVQSGAANVLTDARVLLTATALGGGKVLLAGGGSASADLFTLGDTPAQSTIEPLGPMLASRTGHTATVLRASSRACPAGGCVLLAGGVAGKAATWEVFDPSSLRFTRPAGALEMRTSRARHAATLLSDGRVLFAGGTANGKSGLVSTEVFDPARLRFSAGLPLDLSRVGPGFAYAPAQDLLVLVGGGAEATELITAP